MDAYDAAVRTAEPIGQIAAQFMIDAATYELGGKLGYDGVDFYFGGRGGALGDVPGSVVAAAFVFFNPTTVAEGWERSGKVAPRAESAAAFIACGHAWAEEKLPDGVDYGRLAELAGGLAQAASPAGAPLFAAWAAQPEPSSPRALALHRMNVLRELRGGLHGAAVIAQGLAPVEAVMVKTPYMAALFGWSEPLPDAVACQQAWDRAEEATNRAMARSFTALGDGDRSEFVELAGAALGG